jgi:hypothetical protein
VLTNISLAVAPQPPLARWPVVSGGFARIMRSFIVALVLCFLINPVRAEECIASVYAIGDSSQPGTQTASGVPLNDEALTAAHKSLPFGM